MLGQLYRSLTVGACAFLALSAYGCSGSEQAAHPSATTASAQPQDASHPVERKLTLKQYEATLNPSDFDQTVEIVQRTHETEKKIQELEIPRDSTVIEETVSQGFRIQIYSSSNIDEANDAKTVAVAKFARDSVYLMYDAPVYKVRIGDFISRYEASQKLSDIVDQGYRDAWVVPDRIVQRKVRVVGQSATPK